MLAAVLAAAAVLLLGQASASDSDSEPHCQYGAISAVGPVDAEGNGDTTPDVRCIGP